MYYLAKSLDPTSLVEDNSICCGRGHTETDINSWHEYLPGWGWEEHLRNLIKILLKAVPFILKRGLNKVTSQISIPNVAMFGAMRAALVM